MLLCLERRDGLVAVELYDAVEPRADVLAGTLTDSVFAASLDEVVAGAAPDAYGDADAFFAATHPLEPNWSVRACGN